MKKIILLLPLVFVVLLSGCVGQAPTKEGVKINTFSYDPTSPVEPGYPVYVRLELENVGGALAKGVTADIIGINDWTPSTGRLQSIGDLDYKDESRGITQGGIGYAEWELTPPERQVQIPYDINVRVQYGYSTTFEGRVAAQTIDYYRQTGKKTGLLFQKSTNGPITITVSAPNTIISAKKIPIVFTIKNEGSGRVLGDKLKFTTSTGLSCRIDTVTLSGGKSGTLFCYLSTPLEQSEQYKEYYFSITSVYNYSTEKTTSIQVLPKLPE